MKMPHPGELRHRIEIGKTVNTVNENGFPVETETVLHTVWAGIEDGSSRWYYAADANNAERGLMFVVRWLPGIAPGLWVRWNGEKHLITEIGEYDFKRRYLKLTTKNTKGAA